MADGIKILFVDDEPAIRLTLPAILESVGFKVVAAATVPEALSIIGSQIFDVLISDLNIGSPGDGFTVVSAMRRTQPDAVTFILTGYPAFETALEAIRQQVDDYLVKPTDIQELVDKIKTKLDRTKSLPQGRIKPQRLPALVRENRDQIVEEWLKRVNHNDEIAAIRLTKEERIDCLPQMLEDITKNAANPSESAVQGAAEHGITRSQQGYSIPMLVREAKLLQDAIGNFAQQNLLAIEISDVIPDLIRIGGMIELALEESIKAFTQEKRRAPEEIREGIQLLLLLSVNLETALLRAHTLRSSGFEVMLPTSKKDAMAVLRKKKFDAVIISYSISAESAVEMTELFRENNPGAPIIAITKGEWADLKTDVDASVNGDEGPDALIEAIRTAISRKKMRIVKRQ
ncbi:MAG TPA: response regulator [Candidatus Angelobacter sp.]|nr:response regulator [Candidatus Angelobacter sp.]